jgi:hypothetical protein
MKTFRPVILRQSFKIYKFMSLLIQFQHLSCDKNLSKNITDEKEVRTCGGNYSLWGKITSTIPLFFGHSTTCNSSSQRSTRRTPAASRCRR